MTDRLARRPQFAGLPVPWVARWSNEVRTAHELAYRVSATPDGMQFVRFNDDSLNERDGNGILWQKDRSDPGSGVPDFGAVHTQRQRRAQVDGICQVCGVRNLGTRRLYLLSRDEVVMQHDRQLGDDWLTQTPPVCHDCAEAAPRWCPHLKRLGYVVLEGDARPIAAAGEVAWIDESGRLHHEKAYIRLDAPGRLNLIAKQMLVELTNVEVKVQNPLPQDGVKG